MPLPPPEVLPDLCTFLATSISVLNSSNASLSHNTLLMPIQQASQPALSLLHRTIKTQLNKFGLFRVYDTNAPPLHDPEDPYLVENMSSPPVALEFSCAEHSNQHSNNPYFPYPNGSAMRLGDWYWNQGAQKTRESFRQLLDIIGDPAFSPSTVSETAWSAVDEELGRNLFDGDVPEWLGHDEGWKCSSATISVPFHSRCSKPGPTSYTVDGFYHRSLVSIIKEKLENPAHATFFHFEPYELRWRPPHRQHDIKVYGERGASGIARGTRL